mmetsp:Transcript_52801/g.123504  ORF Transcript_52801/g.123504 Transcript_52801/m.123504 type:complete len:262 (+) Transcript_52801:61-846(+)
MAIVQLSKEDQQMFRVVLKELDGQVLALQRVVDQGTPTRNELDNFVWKATKNVRATINPDARPFTKEFWDDCKQYLKRVINLEKFSKGSKFVAGSLRADVVEKDVLKCLHDFKEFTQKRSQGQGPMRSKGSGTTPEFKSTQDIVKALQNSDLQEISKLLEGNAGESKKRPHEETIDKQNQAEDGWGRSSSWQGWQGRGKSKGKGKIGDWSDLKEKWARMQSSKSNGRWDEEDSDPDEECPDLLKHGSCSFGRQCGFCVPLL